MNRKKVYGKLLLDLILLVLLALMYQKRAISMRFHEWGGLTLCVLFLVHKALNWKWIRSVTAGIFHGKAKPSLRWIVDALLLVSMTAVLITGLLISKTLPTALANRHGLQAWHYFSAAAALALSGIHLGLHGTHLKNNLWNKLPLPETVRKGAGLLLLCALFCLGSVSLVRTNFASLLLRPFLVQSAEHPPFSETEATHFEEAEKRMGRGMGSGMGKGNGMGAGNRQGGGMGHPQEEISVRSAISTCLTYASILCWFAIVTAFLPRCRKKLFQNRRAEDNGTVS